MDELELEAMGQASAEGVNFVPCLRWVRRGVAKATPERVRLDRQDLARIIEDTTAGIKDMDVEEEEEDGVKVEVKEEVEIKQEEVEIKEEVKDEEDDDDDEQFEDVNDDEDDIEKKYGLDKYDEDDEEDQRGGKLNFGDLVTGDDEYADKDDDEEDSDEESEEADLEIKPTDNLILVGHVEGDASILEVYVYNDVEGDMYVHHDILLPSFPLALEWLSYEPGEKVKGNLVAVGSMSPRIDVWDLDLVNSLEPVFSLGSETKRKKKKKMSKARRNRIKAEEGGGEEDGHTDAVLALAWNSHYEHVLASGSVDETVLLWDLERGKVSRKLTQHKEKVQSLQWHPFEAETLLSGCCDHQVRVFNCRSEDAHRSWRAAGEVEKVLWNHFQPATFFCSTDNGHVQLFDVRREDRAVWTLSAHPAGKGVNGLSLSSQCPGCLVTVSSDQTLKVWDVSGPSPVSVAERAMGMGQLHCADGCPDAPFVVCAGGDLPRDNLRVWDVREAAAVRSHFGDRQLVNPLKASEFGYETINAAEKELNLDDDEMEEEEPKASRNKQHVGGGAAGKFRKRDKKKGRQQ